MKFSLQFVVLPSFFFIALSVAAAAAPEPEIRLLKCPAVPETYGKMLTGLTMLKASIKDDATCGAVKKQVLDLEELIGPRREEVMKLIEKSQTEPLRDLERRDVQQYVEDVTQKVFSTAEILDRNNYCFSEDRQSLGLSDLASFTLDATAIAKMVAGPYAAPVALGGQMLASVIQGLDRVVKNRSGYDFEKLESRQSFVQSLCTYYNYRQEIETLLYPSRRTSELTLLHRSLSRNLGSLVGYCEECRQIADMAKSVGKDGLTPQLKQLTSAADGEYQSPLGSYTLQATTSLDWVKGELARIQAQQADESSIGRDLVAEVATDIERFLFEQEAPKFVNFQSRKALNLYREFDSFVNDESTNLLMEAAPYVTLDYYAILQMDTLARVRAVTDFAPELAKKGQNTLVHRIVNFDRKATELYDRTELAINVVASYCDFFRRAGVYNGRMHNACESGLAASVRRNMAKAQAGMEPIIPVQATVDPVVDWAAGLARWSSELSEQSQALPRRRDANPTL